VYYSHNLMIISYLATEETMEGAVKDEPDDLLDFIRSLEARERLPSVVTGVINRNTDVSSSAEAVAAARPSPEVVEFCDALVEWAERLRDVFKQAQRQ